MLELSPPLPVLLLLRVEGLSRLNTRAVQMHVMHGALSVIISPPPEHPSIAVNPTRRPEAQAVKSAVTRATHTLSSLCQKTIRCAS
jgi:hypothetical protein